MFAGKISKFTKSDRNFFQFFQSLIILERLIPFQLSEEGNEVYPTISRKSSEITATESVPVAAVTNSKLKYRRVEPLSREHKVPSALGFFQSTVSNFSSHLLRNPLSSSLMFCLPNVRVTSFGLTK